jgi:hypothetical protein
MQGKALQSRRHGFNLPLHALQLGAIAAFSGLVSGCFAFEIIFIDNDAARGVIITLYSLLVVALIALYVKTR